MKLTVEQALQQGIDAHRDGKLQEAEFLYRAVLNTQPTHPHANHNLGVLLLDIGKINEATAFFKKAVESDSFQPQFLASYISALVDSNKGIAGDQLIATVSRNRDAIYYQKVAQALNNAGVKRKKSKLYGPAQYLYYYALVFKPDYAAALNNLGNLSLEVKNMSVAYSSYKKSICLEPQFLEPYMNLADYFFKEQKYVASLYILYKSFKINPISPLAYLNKGNALTELGKINEVLKSYKAAQVLEPEFGLASYNLGNIYFDKLFQIQAAILEYRKTSMIQVGYSQAAAWLMYLKALTCDWAVNEEQFFSNLENLANLGLDSNPISPFTLLSMEDRPDRHKIRSENYANSLFHSHPIFEFSKKNRNHNKITIAYFSLFLPLDPVFNLIQGVLSLHDRKRFKVTAYLLTNDIPANHLEKLSELFDVVTSVENLSDSQVGELSRKHGVDIAVDLLGYTRGARPGIFSHRAAPIQINFLGYPGTSGASFFDYIIADEVLIPIAHQKFFSEKIIYLPDTYQPQNDIKMSMRAKPTRNSLGLPQEGFIFCCFHNSYKITPNEFRIWLRLLKDVDGSVLWLLKTNDYVEVNLRDAALKYGVDPNRLIFFSRKDYPEYLSSLSAADLFLDAFNYNAGATASDALWAGVPLITKPGLGYPARMASSLLTALNLQELIARSNQEYEEIAYELARNPEKLAAIRNKVCTNIKLKSLFDTEKYTQSLEEGYQTAYQYWLDGEECKHIVVHENSNSISV
jgi:protein O-GlcNAc transferase